MSVKYKRAYDWLEEDDQNIDNEDFGAPPDEINIGSGKQICLFNFDR